MLSILLVAAVIGLGTSVSAGAHEERGHEAQRILEQVASQATQWKNQSGSVMSLSFECGNTVQPAVCQLSGTYVNNASGFNCKGTPYPLSGVYYINTQTMSWSVAWSNSHEDCNSVTGWTGYVDFSQSPIRIITRWNLAYSTGGSGRAIMPGEDVFTQTSTTQSESLLVDP